MAFKEPQTTSQILLRGSAKQGYLLAVSAEVINEINR
jgi:hypothetical protein